MKILYVSEAVLPSESANSISIIHMCIGLSKLHKVTLLCYKGAGTKDIYEYYGIKENPNLNIVRIERNSINCLNKLRILGLAMLQLRKYDIVYTRWVQAANIIASMRHNCVLELHSMLPDKKARLVKKTLERKEVKKVVFINSYLKREYERRFFESNRFVVEPGAASLENNYKGEFRNECGYVGSFYEGKGIEIVCQLANKMKDIRFHIIGGNAEQIQKLIDKYNVGSNVIWYGYQPYSQAMKLTENFGIALLPNQERVFVGNTDIGQYTSPNKLFEYMAHGKVIVASRVKALEEILVDNQNAILVSPTAINEWEHAVREVIEDTELRKKLTKKGTEQVNSKYNWESRANRIIDSL